jgi:GNAT superfamily N-acetyltransferase
VNAVEKIALAQDLRRLAIWLDGCCQPAGFVGRQFDGPPFGCCYATIDPERQGPFASSNHNRVHLCGTEAGMTPDGIERLIELYRSEGVNRFFVWVSPGPDRSLMRHWLELRGLSRVTRTAYPTLCRKAGGPAPFTTELAIREVGPDDVARASEAMGDSLWPEYAMSAGRQGFFHYLAYDGERPVATAALCKFETLGYLMMASTVESHRGRGAQTALIAARIAKAEAIGCSILVSETLKHLEHSLHNLLRAGFEQVYEKEVYEWNA